MRLRGSGSWHSRLIHAAPARSHITAKSESVWSVESHQMPWNNIKLIKWSYAELDRKYHKQNIIKKKTTYRRILNKWIVWSLVHSNNKCQQMSLDCCKKKYKLLSVIYFKKKKTHIHVVYIILVRFVLFVLYIHFRFEWIYVI